MSEISRRSLLKGGCALLLLGGTSLPIAADAAVKRLPRNRLSVRVRSIPELSVVGGAVRIGNIKGAPIGLARTGENSYRAFNLNCPHQGYAVERDATGWICPAHNSQFEADGDLLLGPSTTGLKRVPARVSGAQVIVG